MSGFPSLVALIFLSDGGKREKPVVADPLLWSPIPGISKDYGLRNDRHLGRHEDASNVAERFRFVTLGISDITHKDVTQYYWQSGKQLDPLLVSLHQSL